MLKKTIKGLTHEAQELLRLYDYPGNIRELENIIKRAMVISETEWTAEGDKLDITFQPYDVIWLVPYNEKA